MEKIFGWELIIDIKDCNERIKDRKSLKSFITKLCKTIDMVPYGKALIEHFGHKSDITSGYSIAQLIETSLISGHFSEKYKTAHLNIFSCKQFDSKLVKDFCLDFFGGEIIADRWIKRRLE